MFDLPFSMTPLLAQADSGASALIAFTIYMGGVMALAVLSNRLLQSKTFLSEYFLGSRSLGVWAFALTFAATSSSGGSFMGFPSLVYTHGWIVALWIGSYMIVPIFSMGLLAKRINQVARKTGAITIPDVLRDRFHSPGFGALATALIVFFMAFNLVAQFKSGSVILKTLLADMTWFHRISAMVGGDDPGYVLCLIFFAIVVIAYTTYGGFRAVVWTDVMQGFVMVAGVMIMLPLAIYLVGGLGAATQEMAEMTPPRHVKLQLSRSQDVDASRLLKRSAWLSTQDGDDVRLFRLTHAAQFEEQQTELEAEAIEITYAPHIERVLKEFDDETRSQVAAYNLTVTETTPYEGGGGETGVYVAGPGPSADMDSGFLPLALAVSFFFMWTWSGAGQPSNMIRLMAFNSSNTLRRAILTVAIYYSMIYFPLVIIFTCARVLLPGWETESDRIMPEMAKMLTAAINAPWLAGLLVAAPFAAVMSTMDSFLLMISSAVVRDVYQRSVNPTASEKTIKTMTYAVTLAVGAGAMAAALNPPQFLQDIIVFTGSGLSTSFLAPVALSLYWPRFNKQGAIAGMFGGFATHATLYATGYIMYGRMQAYEPLGFHPFMAGLAASVVISLVVALSTTPPPQKLVYRFFHEP